MTETEREILLLFRQLTPREKQQFSDICKSLHTLNVSRFDTGKEKSTNA